MSEKYQREMYIASLYLAKFNGRAVEQLGCKTQKEAFEKIAEALSTKPATIKNIRDYFDVFFPNERKGWHKVEPYKIIRDTFSEFGNYDFEKLTEIVKDILEENFLSESLKEIIETEKNIKRKERNPEEQKCVLSLWKIEGGKTEVPIVDYKSGVLVGLADLITDKEIIEVKNIKNWKHSLGQIFAYWYHFSLNTDVSNQYLIPRIHLFGGDGIYDDRIKLCQFLMQEIFSPHTNLAKVTYAEDFQDFQDFD